MRADAGLTPRYTWTILFGSRLAMLHVVPCEWCRV